MPPTEISHAVRPEAGKTVHRPLRDEVARARSGKKATEVKNLKAVSNMTESFILRGFEVEFNRARAAFRVARFDDALAILDRYRGLLSVDVEFMVLYAEIIDRMGDFAGADALLSRALEINPAHAQALVVRAACLTNLGRRSEAVGLLDGARAANPDNADLLGHYLALLLTHSGAPAAIAVLKSEHLRKTPPRRLDAAVERLRQKALALHDPAELAQMDPEDFLELKTSTKDQSYSLRQIYETLEPMGCNCELGFVQRRSGAEPLSLLRWTAITPEQLIALLGCDMEGYEEPSRYRLSGNFNHEFILSEDEFGTKTHTGVSQSDISPVDFLDRMTRRQAFLKRKFLADAAQGRKIFTYKADSLLDDQQITGVEDQLRRLGVQYCLFVMPAVDQASGGTVQFSSPGRGVGYLSSVLPRTCYEEWNSIAIETYDRFIRQQW
jgi:tetratricopeptide (TPR) repeat protein